MLRHLTIVVTFIFLSSHQSTAQKKNEVLSPAKINKLVPLKLKGYTLKDAKSKHIKLGNIVYSLSERTFENGAKSVKILLFDYVDAPVMYNQAIKKWSEMNTIESDSVIFKPMNANDTTAWESYTSSSNHSQIVMGINNRFFLTIDGYKIELNELTGVLGDFEFQKFPK